MCLDEGVSYENAVFMGYEHLLLGEDHAAHAVSGAGHALAVKLAYVFVAVWTVYASAVAVESEIELRSMLYDGAVERRQQYV